MADLLAGISVLAALAAVIGLATLVVARYLPARGRSPADEINDLLPQTQCAQCGFPGCKPYADAIIDGTADIDQCVPGGNALVNSLARLLGRRSTELNPAFGEQAPPSVARIDEDACIGCVLCIAACPVDAIVGAARFTHTVISDECTGCELCVAPCPVDCIVMEPLAPIRKTTTSSCP